MDIEKRINRIFSTLDIYTGHYEELTKEEIRFLIHEYARTRRLNVQLRIVRDEKLYTLEKDLRWLLAIMKNRNLNKITR